MPRTPEVSMSIDEYVKKRNEILRTMDVFGFVSLMLDVEGNYINPDVALLTMHKARYEVFSMPRELRNESREWLEKRGYSRMYGLAWPPAGVMPESVK